MIAVISINASTSSLALKIGNFAERNESRIVPTDQISNACESQFQPKNYDENTRAPTSGLIFTLQKYLWSSEASRTRSISFDVMPLIYSVWALDINQ